MKKIISALALVLIAGTLSAKKVKFAVDMTGQTISSGGVHIVGDFQSEAGLGADWDPATAPMTQVGTSQVYSIVVNIPAFTKYEYKFINGNITYDSEVVPVESRVNLFGDNRWLYVDSLGTDTAYVGAILFGGNAPAGKKLVRYQVNIAHISLPASGIHVGTSGQSFDATKLRMYSFGNSVYEFIDYVAAGSYSYKFFGGNTAASAETVPSSCASAGNRTLTVSQDTVLAEVCFASCSACLDVGIQQNSLSQVKATLFPNPATALVTLQTNLSGTVSLLISDCSGKSVMSLSGFDAGSSTVDVSRLERGLYFVKIASVQGSQTTKLIVE